MSERYDRFEHLMTRCLDGEASRGERRELASAWVRVLSCEQIAEELERSVDILETSACSGKWVRPRHYGFYSLIGRFPGRIQNRTHTGRLRPCQQKKEVLKAGGLVNNAAWRDVLWSIGANKG